MYKTYYFSWKFIGSDKQKSYSRTHYNSLDVFITFHEIPIWTKSDTIINEMHYKSKKFNIA